jgi:hypothetical protein
MKVNSTVLFTIIASSIPKLSITILLTLSWANPSLAKLESAEIVGNPTVNKNRVTLRIKVKENDGRPALNLKEDDFTLMVDGKPVKFKPRDWKSSQATTPPPVWIVFLLDYSGSMNGKDTRGTTKLEGAITAIRGFIKSTAKRNGDTKVVVVPFGEGEGKSASCARPVTKEEIDRFFPAGDAKVYNQLESLATGKPCASTNIYDPVIETVNFFNNSQDARFVEKEGVVRPRTSIIILSDGYHNKNGEIEREAFDRLIAKLKQQESVVIHTLGYGLTPEELGKKTGLGRPAKRSDVVEKKVKEEEFVDRDRLKQIAKVTGGVAEFSPDAQTVSQKLDIFLNAILGEYEISYSELNPERGSKHEVTVIVTPNGEKPIESPAKAYNIGVFGRSLEFNHRLFMILGIGFIVLIGGVLPFWFWGKQLKQEV